MDEKKLSALSNIQRNLGVIEGIACGLELPLGNTIFDSLENIDRELEVLKNDT